MFINKQSLVIHGLTAAISAVSLSSVLFLGYITSEINAIIQSAKVASGEDIDKTIIKAEGTKYASNTDEGLCIAHTVSGIRMGGREAVLRWNPEENLFKTFVARGDAAKVITRGDLNQIYADCKALSDLYSRMIPSNPETQEHITTFWAQKCVFGNPQFSRFIYPIMTLNGHFRDVNALYDPNHQGTKRVSACFRQAWEKWHAYERNLSTAQKLKAQRETTLISP